MPRIRRSRAFARAVSPCVSLCGLLAAGCIASVAAADQHGAAPDPSDPPSVILIIGDGMDDTQITIARNYLVGTQGRLGLDDMPVRGTSQVLTVAEDDPDRPVFVADSANSATSFSTGAVTSRGRVATSPGSDRDLTTIVELAEAAGMRTGLVTTASVTDATPAVFAAHVSKRLCENPGQMVDIEFRGIPLGGCPQDTKANGGPGSISEQLAVSGVDVLLGGGRRHFAPAAEGREETVLELAIASGFRVVEDAEALRAAPPDARLLGLFSESTMPVRWRGEGDRSAEKPSPSLMHRVHRYLGSVALPEPMTCEPNPAFVGQPTLAEMTAAALAHLTHEGGAGFFLMIESASIDKQSHRRNACGAIGELQQLEESLALALAHAAEHPRTLVLVTADHGHAAQIVPDESLFSRFGVPVYTPGRLVRLTTPEGGVMAIGYATNDFQMEEHTGTAVPLFANEAGRGVVPPMVTHPEVFDLMVGYLGLAAPAASEATPAGGG